MTLKLNLLHLILENHTRPQIAWKGIIDFPLLPDRHKTNPTKFANPHPYTPQTTLPTTPCPTDANPHPYTHQTTHRTTPCPRAPRKTNPQNLRSLTPRLEVRTPIHPGRLTWKIQITHLERKIILQTSMLIFQGVATAILGEKNNHHPWLEFPRWKSWSCKDALWTVLLWVFLVTNAVEGSCPRNRGGGRCQVSPEDFRAYLSRWRFASSKLLAGENFSCHALDPQLMERLSVERRDHLYRSQTTLETWQNSSKWMYSNLKLPGNRFKKILASE